MKGTNLQGANLASAEFSWHQTYRGNELVAVPKWEVAVSAILDNANLSYANLFRADLQGVSLNSANLTQANLQQTNLSYANLEEANLNSTNLELAYIYRVNFTDADLRNANLMNKDISSSTSFKGAKYNSQTIFPPDFDPEKAEMVFIP